MSKTEGGQAHRAVLLAKGGGGIGCDTTNILTCTPKEYIGTHGRV